MRNIYNSTAVKNTLGEINRLALPIRIDRIKWTFNGRASKIGFDVVATLGKFGDGRAVTLKLEPIIATFEPTNHGKPEISVSTKDSFYYIRPRQLKQELLKIINAIN